MERFDRAVIESVLCSLVVVWFGAATKKIMTKSDCNELFRLPRSSALPTLNNFQEQNKGRQNPLDPLHPGHHLFQLVPSGMSYQTLHTTGNAQGLGIICIITAVIVGYYRTYGILTLFHDSLYVCVASEKSIFF